MRQLPEAEAFGTVIRRKVVIARARALGEVIVNVRYQLRRYFMKLELILDH